MSLTADIGTRNAAIDAAFMKALLEAVEEAPVVAYMAAAFKEEVRLALGEPEMDAEAEATKVEEEAGAGSSDSSGSSSDEGATDSTHAKHGTKAHHKSSKAQRKTRRRTQKKKKAKAKKKGSTFRVKRERQVGYEQAVSLVQETVVDELEAHVDGVDDVTSIVEALVKALVEVGVARDVDDDAFDVVCEMGHDGSGGSKLEEHEVTEGATCIAVLEEDGDWHEAVVKEVVGEDSFRVMFTEWCKPQLVTRKQLVLDVDRADLAGGDDEEGQCELCERDTKLTAHHLIPRATHNKYLRRGYTQEQLNTCAMICRKCHNVVHQFKTNKELAAKFNTIAVLREQPFIQRWVTYARTKAPRSHAECKAHLAMAK